MDEQTTTDAAISAADAVSRGHRRAENEEYEVIFHPAFASACTVTKNGQKTATDLYRQGDQQEDVIDCTDGHPETHVIRIRGKANGRDITITVHDPSHTLHRISFDLYQKARDRKVWRKPEAVAANASTADASTADASADSMMAGVEGGSGAGSSSGVGETFTLENEAKTCPPYCEEKTPT